MFLVFTSIQGIPAQCCSCGRGGSGTDNGLGEHRNPRWASVRYGEVTESAPAARTGGRGAGTFNFFRAGRPRFDWPIATSLARWKNYAAGFALASRSPTTSLASITPEWTILWPNFTIPHFWTAKRFAINRAKAALATWIGRLFGTRRPPGPVCLHTPSRFGRPCLRLKSDKRT